MVFSQLTLSTPATPEDQAGLAARARQHVSEYWRSQTGSSRGGYDDASLSDEPTVSTLAAPPDAVVPRITVDSLAQALGVDGRRLARAFMATQGMKLVDYLKSERMRHAQRLLLQTSMSVGEIAYVCGYASGANFATAFRAHAGMSPLQFRAEPPDEVLQESRGLVRWP